VVNSPPLARKTARLRTIDFLHSLLSFLVYLTMLLQLNILCDVEEAGRVMTGRILCYLMAINTCQPRNRTYCTWC